MFDTKAKAFWITGAGKAELRAEILPVPGPDEVGVRTLYSAISRGTEGLVWRGAVPESEAETMRAPFQVGDFPWPVKYGYIAVGEIEAGPKTLMGCKVFCLHPHQDRFVVPAGAVTVLPGNLPPARAVLAANMETAVNALWDARPLAGERIAVIGAGVIGALVAWLASRIPGTHVQLIDTLAAKASVAAALGVEFAAPETAAKDADLVVHASGNPLGLETALTLAGTEARIVELSWYGTARVSLPLGAAFHTRRLKLISSQVGRLPPHLLPRWDHKRRMELALDLLRDSIFEVLISGEDDFAELPKVFPRVVDDPTVLCHRIRY